MCADDFWKKQAFSKASAVLTDHPEKVESGKAAMKLKGVGKGCAAVVRCLHRLQPDPGFPSWLRRLFRC